MNLLIKLIKSPFLDLPYFLRLLKPIRTSHLVLHLQKCVIGH